MDAGLFSSELGSTPLYRYSETLRLNASKGIGTNSLNRTNMMNKELPPVTGVTENLEDEIKEPGDNENEPPETEKDIPPQRG